MIDKLKGMPDSLPVGLEPRFKLLDMPAAMVFSAILCEGNALKGNQVSFVRLANSPELPADTLWESVTIH